MEEEKVDKLCREIIESFNQHEQDELLGIPNRDYELVMWTIKYLMKNKEVLS